MDNPGKTFTVILRGSNDLVLREVSRSLHDGQCVVRSLVQARALTAAGGVRVAVARTRPHSQGQGCLLYGRVRERCRSHSVYTDVVTELRTEHAAGKAGVGISIKQGGSVADTLELHVVQPLLVTTSALRLATETVAMILIIDDLIVVQ